VSPGHIIQHVQMGHSETLGERLYARNADGHPQLTDRFCHDTMDFCLRWQHIWGFDTEVPDLSMAKHFYEEFEMTSGKPPIGGVCSCGQKMIDARLNELQGDLLNANTKIEALVSVTTQLVSKLDALSCLQCPAPPNATTKDPPVAITNKSTDIAHATASASKIMTSQATVLRTRHRRTTTVQPDPRNALPSMLTLEIPMSPRQIEQEQPSIPRDLNTPHYATTAHSMDVYNKAHQNSEPRPHRPRATATVRFMTPGGSPSLPIWLKCR
jgi:hypothetical protein